MIIITIGHLHYRTNASVSSSVCGLLLVWSKLYLHVGLTLECHWISFTHTHTQAVLCNLIHVSSCALLSIHVCFIEGITSQKPA